MKKILSVGLVGLVLLGAGSARTASPDPVTRLAPMHKERFVGYLGESGKRDKYQKMMERSGAVFNNLGTTF